MPAPARLIVNLDVPDLARAEHFYCAVFGLAVGRRFGGRAVELLGLEAPLYLLSGWRQPGGPGLVRGATASA